MKQTKLIESVKLLTLIGLLIMISLYCHFTSRNDSMLNDKNNIISETYLQDMIVVHKTHETFKLRPLTTFLVENVANITNISTGTSFVVINFLLFAISGILLYLLSKKLGSGPNAALVNVGIYFLCFSNIFAFFIPIYSYDDPLQFVCVFAALYFYFKDQLLLFILFFTLALITRESTMLLLPGLVLYLHLKKGYAFKDLFAIKSIIRIMLLALPVVLYFLFTFIYVKLTGFSISSEAAVAERFSHFSLNFETQAGAVETFVSIYVVCGLVLYFTYYTLKNKILSPQQYNFLHAFLLTFLLNTLVVIILAKAREARLFAIPLFFIWPVFVSLFREELRKLTELKNYKLIFLNWKRTLYFLLCLFFSNLIWIKAYKKTLWSEGDFFPLYLFLYTLIILIHFFITYGQDKQKRAGVL